MYPSSLHKIINFLKKVPGIGEKTAERMALSFLEMDEEQLSIFGKTIISLPKTIKKCQKCGFFCEKDQCDICLDETRNNQQVCIVENSKNVIVFEKTNSFNGKYHVLNGLISPLDGKNPEDINIFSLIKRIDEEKIKEVIIAVKPSIEGETTALYIKKIVEDKKVKVSKIAYGIPIGADIEYIDGITLGLALEERKEMK